LALHSFPTRRSSDLGKATTQVLAAFLISSSGWTQYGIDPSHRVPTPQVQGSTWKSFDCRNPERLHSLIFSRHFSAGATPPSQPATIGSCRLEPNPRFMNF